MSERGHGERCDSMAAARAFVEAVAWGDHYRVWELLSGQGRDAVLRIAVGRGMDDGLAGRLRTGQATSGEDAAFLADLVNGLRADLAGNDLDVFVYDFAVGGEGTAEVAVLADLPGPLADLPVATVELRIDGGRWRVDRLVPRFRR